MPEYRWRLLAMAVLCGPLCNCAHGAYPDRQAAGEICMTFGLRESTPEFDRCVNVEVGRIAEERQRILQHIQHTPQPTNTPRTSG
jgi:hypothetical protein